MKLEMTRLWNTKLKSMQKLSQLKQILYFDIHRDVPGFWFGSCLEYYNYRNNYEWKSNCILETSKPYLLFGLATLQSIGCPLYPCLKRGLSPILQCKFFNILWETPAQWPWITKFQWYQSIDWIYKWIIFCDWSTMALLSNHKQTLPGSITLFIIKFTRTYEKKGKILKIRPFSTSHFYTLYPGGATRMSRGVSGSSKNSRN